MILGRLQRRSSKNANVEIEVIKNKILSSITVADEEALKKAQLELMEVMCLPEKKISGEQFIVVG